MIVLTENALNNNLFEATINEDPAKRIIRGSLDLLYNIKNFTPIATTGRTETCRYNLYPKNRVLYTYLWEQTPDYISHLLRTTKATLGRSGLTLQDLIIWREGSLLTNELVLKYHKAETQNIRLEQLRDIPCLNPIHSIYRSLTALTIQ